MQPPPYAYSRGERYPSVRSRRVIRKERCESAQLLRQPDMNFLRSSPFSFFSVACLLQAVMRSCCAFFAGVASAPLPPFRQPLMNFLRPSPFFSAALALQSFMRSFCFFFAAVGSFFASFLS